MIKELTIYFVSKSSGGTPAVINALISCGIFTRKWASTEPGCLAVPLTEDEAEKLRNLGCVVTKDKAGRTIPQMVQVDLQVA